ncbi:hypothetical protein HK099_002894 [Clydaea vesicula]|uniref:Uncharacterized protein n=1 Tax=Clydaea vesicula TaxID=447962 RepID=A0AAD5UC47_9FUNG|nr:hypothetical protein HK099_002894 [Clydaea vesicula]
MEIAEKHFQEENSLYEDRDRMNLSLSDNTFNENTDVEEVKKDLTYSQIPESISNKPVAKPVIYKSSHSIVASDIKNNLPETDSFFPNIKETVNFYENNISDDQRQKNFDDVNIQNTTNFKEKISSSSQCHENIINDNQHISDQTTPSKTKFNLSKSLENFKANEELKKSYKSIREEEVKKIPNLKKKNHNRRTSSDEESKKTFATKEKRKDLEDNVIEKFVEKWKMATPEMPAPKLKRETFTGARSISNQEEVLQMKKKISLTGSDRTRVKSETNLKVVDAISNNSGLSNYIRSNSMETVIKEDNNSLKNSSNDYDEFYNDDEYKKRMLTTRQKNFSRELFHSPKTKNIAEDNGMSKNLKKSKKNIPNEKIIIKNLMLKKEEIEKKLRKTLAHSRQTTSSFKKYNSKNVYEVREKNSNADSNQNENNIKNFEIKKKKSKVEKISKTHQNLSSRSKILSEYATAAYASNNVNSEKQGHNVEMHKGHVPTAENTSTDYVFENNVKFPNQLKNAIKLIPLNTNCENQNPNISSSKFQSQYHQNYAISLFNNPSDMTADSNNYYSSFNGNTEALAAIPIKHDSKNPIEQNFFCNDTGNFLQICNSKYQNETAGRSKKSVDTGNPNVRNVQYIPLQEKRDLNVYNVTGTFSSGDQVQKAHYKISNKQDVQLEVTDVNHTKQNYDPTIFCNSQLATYNCNDIRCNVGHSNEILTGDNLSSKLSLVQENGTDFVVEDNNCKANSSCCTFPTRYNTFGTYEKPVEVIVQNRNPQSSNGLKTIEDNLKILSKDLQIASEVKATVDLENIQLKKEVTLLKKKLLNSVNKINVLQQRQLNVPPPTTATRSISFPLGTSKIPTSVQANLNLRYQFKQKLEIERVKYDCLVQENRNLAGRIKTLEFQLAKKGISVDQKSHKTNEVLYWKNKFKDSEKEIFKTKEYLNAKLKQLEKETRNNQKLQKKIQNISTHYTHIPPSSFNEQQINNVLVDNEFDFMDEASVRNSSVTNNEMRSKTSLNSNDFAKSIFPYSDPKNNSNPAGTFSKFKSECFQLEGNLDTDNEFLVMQDYLAPGSTVNHTQAPSEELKAGENPAVTISNHAKHHNHGVAIVRLRTGGPDNDVSQLNKLRANTEETEELIFKLQREAKNLINNCSNFNSNENPAESVINNEKYNLTPEELERMRLAKVQVEYDVWIGGRPDGKVLEINNS